MFLNTDACATIYNQPTDENARSHVFTGQEFSNSLPQTINIQNQCSRRSKTQCAKINQPMRLLVSDPSLNKHKHKVEQFASFDIYEKHGINYQIENQKRPVGYQSALSISYMVTNTVMQHAY
jgi:hypothetical protein